MFFSNDALAKSFYSAVLADLGSNKSTVLTDDTALKLFTSRFPGISSDLVASGSATDSYIALQGGPGKPKISPSTILMTYLSQTPECKLTTALIV
jgi:hypothetical protein